VVDSISRAALFRQRVRGIWWNANANTAEASWGYGARPASIEEFYARFEKLCAVLLGDRNMFGYCYTQLTDVYQEQNGIYTFGRIENLTWQEFGPHRRNGRRLRRRSE